MTDRTPRAPVRISDDEFMLDSGHDDLMFIAKAIPGTGQVVMSLTTIDPETKRPGQIVLTPMQMMEVAHRLTSFAQSIEYNKAASQKKRDGR